MKKGLKSYTNKELLAEISQRGFCINRKLPKPTSARCFKCENQFSIKWVTAQNNYAKKNSWDYWTGKKSDKEFKICNDCLRSFYLNKRQEFLQTITDLKKRNHLRSYVSHKVI